ncbi:MAG TPA: hypothetical protein VH143_21230 [Kofleriaceae bacterium]|nr:hypothetical protein [Kofleriaceae bacterium]
MSESFVDLTYRGLAVGRRVKLTQVRPSSGYLELPTPMPVGTAIGIASDDGLLTSAIVTEIHEQVGGSEHVPGMLVKPALESDIVRTWWSARVTLPELAATPPPIPAVSTVRPKRASAVPELVDDGRNTAAMAAMEEPAADDDGDTQQIDVIEEVTAPPLIDDGKRTIAMAAVDLEALGLDPSASTTGSIPVMNDGDDEPSSPSDTKPGGSVHRRKRKRR